MANDEDDLIPAPRDLAAGDLRGDIQWSGQLRVSPNSVLAWRSPATSQPKF